MAWSDAHNCGQCGGPIPPSEGRGRRRQYCSSTCRSAARRDRDQLAREASGLLDRSDLQAVAAQVAARYIAEGMARSASADLLLLRYGTQNQEAIRAAVADLAESLRNRANLSTITKE